MGILLVQLAKKNGILPRNNDRFLQGFLLKKYPIFITLLTKLIMFVKIS